MVTEKQIKHIQRQRIAPKIWDYSYLLLRSNRRAFDIFVERLNKQEPGELLDVGCGFKPWAPLLPREWKHVGVDFDEAYSSADSIASSDELPFADDSFDALIYSEVLEHVDDLSETLAEMRRVAKDGCFVFVSSPFMFPIHSAPHDFRRLTKYAYKKFFANDDVIILRCSNSSLATVCVAANLFIESSPLIIFRGVKEVIFTVLNILGLVADVCTNVFVKLIPQKYKKYEEYFYTMPLGYVLVAKLKK